MGPGSPPRGRAVGGGRAPDPGRPTPRARGAPPGHPHAAPTARKASWQERALWGWCRVATPAPPPHPQPVGSGPRQPAQKAGIRGRESARHQTPHTTVVGHPPPGTAPHLTTPAARSPHRACRPRGQCWAPTPTHPRSQHVGSGPQQPAQWAGSRGGGAPDLRRPPQQQPGRGEPGPDRPPPKHARRSKGPGQDTQRDTDHVERPYQRPVPGPREVRTPHHPGEGGADAAGARAHTHAKSTRGLPEGQPDGDRGTHRPRGMVYQRERIRDSRTERPATRSTGYGGRGGGNGRDTTPGTGPSPPNWPRRSRTHGRGTAPAKAVVAHCATPQPLG